MKISEEQYITVKISTQKLYLYTAGKLQIQYKVSTSKYGIGNEPNTYKTPLGKHKIIRKFGEGVQSGGIFRRGKFTGENCYRIAATEEDLITSRIFVLEGLEKGKNDNSRQRGIWVHGTQQEDLIGTAASHGCIRLRNNDMIDLFEQVQIGTIVDIKE